MREYFATLPVDRIAPELMKRTEDYNKYLLTSGRMKLWSRSYNYYYGPAFQGSRLKPTGEQGEFTSIAVNHYRNLLTHLKTLTASQRPAFEPRATNSDYKSQAQTILASGLLDYYLREKKMERVLKNAVEHALIFGEGFVLTGWDTTLGEVYSVDPETSQVIREGDIDYKNFLPMQVVRDFTKDSPNSDDWYILITRENRYTLMAKFPELADRIEALPSYLDYEKQLKFNSQIQDDTDDVAVYQFYHKATAAVTDGRVVHFCGSEVVLLDGPLPYKQLPIYRIAPDDQIGSCFGYTVGFDLLPVMEAIDRLYSTVITNQSTFGVQNIALPKGHDLSVTSLAGGLNLIEYDSKLGAPSALNLTATPPEIFNFIGQLEKLAETLSGVNSVARGNPEASLKSGSALALVMSQAIQFANGLQQSYANLMEDLGTATINILRDFASVPRVAVIAGKSQRSLMKQFTGDDLNMINRVVVDMGNPLSRSTAGKTQLAENLLQNGLIKNAEQYIQVMATGRLEPVIEGTQAELLNIKAENETLAMGEQVPVILTDSHLVHINEHRAILASPEARRQPELIAVVLDHIQQHMNILQDPAMAAVLGALGQQSLAQPPGPVESSAPTLDATATVMQQAEDVNMPRPPKNPLTGEDAELLTPQ